MKDIMVILVVIWGTGFHHATTGMMYANGTEPGTLYMITTGCIIGALAFVIGTTKRQ